jgi:hypothetical protein
LYQGSFAICVSVDPAGRSQAESMSRMVENAFAIAAWSSTICPRPSMNRLILSELAALRETVRHLAQRSIQ